MSELRANTWVNYPETAARLPDQQALDAGRHGRLRPGRPDRSVGPQARVRHVRRVVGTSEA